MNDLGSRLISDAEELIKSNADIEDIREAMNAVYRHFKREIRHANISDKRLLKVFCLERLMKNKFLPLENEPIYDENENVSLPREIKNEEDCHQALRFIVHETRKDLSKYHDLKNAILEKNCIGTSGFVSRLCEKYGIADRDFSLDENLGTGIFHCFNVVSFNVGGEVKSYLVDCTYRQFFTYSDAFMERIGMPYNSGPSMGAYMMMDDDRKKMAEQLLTTGYIEFTPEVAKAYFDSIVFAGRNGLYYEGLGKDKLERSDLEPGYTFQEYMEIIDNGGLGDSDLLGRQRAVLRNPNIQFDSKEAMPYVGSKVEESSTGNGIKK